MKVGLDDLAAWSRLGRARIDGLVAAGSLPAPVAGGWEAGAVLPVLFDLFRAALAIPEKSEEQAKKMAAQREMVELELHRARGAVVPVEVAEAALAALAGEVRDKLLAAPSRFGVPREAIDALLIELATASGGDSSGDGVAVAGGQSKPLTASPAAISSGGGG